MSRNVRASTLKKSIESQSKSVSKGSQSRGNKSLKSLQSSKATELPSVVREVENLDSTEQDEVSTDGEDYWIDTTAYSFTSVADLPSPGTPFPEPPTEPDNWSTSVNRFGSVTAVAEGVEASSTIGSFPLLSPRAELEKVGSPVQTIAVDNILLNSSQSSSHNSSIETVKDISMDNAEYNAKYMELDGLKVNIQSLIARFNKDTVSLLDLGTF